MRSHVYYKEEQLVVAGEVRAASKSLQQQQVGLWKSP